jgi:hypothetical protein
MLFDFGFAMAQISKAHGLWGQAKFQRTDSAPFAAMVSSFFRDWHLLIS